VLLTPRQGVETKPQLFLLGLHAFGQGKQRHWLVNYWAPYGAPKIPQGWRQYLPDLADSTA